MAEEYNKCPKCYNYIDEFNIDKTLINREQGGLGTDENGDPLPFWSDDPIFTPLGLSGDDYKGMEFPKRIHYQELREYYNNLETDLGLENTVWTDDLTDTTKKISPKKVYIEELRIAIEALLLEKDLNIIDYFSLDRYGNVIQTAQTDWTDIERDEFNSPLLPGKTLIKAIHIEELRRGIYLTSLIFLETWTDNEPSLIESDSHSITQPSYPETKIYPRTYSWNQVHENIEADYIWDDMLHHLEIRALTWENHIEGETSINLSGGNLVYNGAIIANGDYRFCRGRIWFEADLGLGKIPPDVQKIISGRTLSWTGSFVGSAIPENNNKCSSYAYIRLTMHEFNPFISYDIILIKYATGSVFLTSSGNTIISPLTSWTGNNIDLYDLLGTLGFDMEGKQHFLVNIGFRFEVEVRGNIYGINAGQASIETSIDNIRVR